MFLLVTLDRRQTLLEQVTSWEIRSYSIHEICTFAFSNPCKLLLLPFQIFFEVA